MWYFYYLGKYQPFEIDSAYWRRVTGKDGKLTRHESSATHKAAVDMYAARMVAQSSVGVHLSQAYADKLQRENEQKQTNRAALEAIIDVIRFLARQNISFRGHREGVDADNRGNFLELVTFTAKHNAVLRDWLENHPKNVSWLSPDIQNELLHLLSVELLAKIVDEFRGKCFSILCDEVSDRANSELVSIVIRYVTNSGTVREVLVGLVKVENTTSENLYSIIVSKLHELYISVDDLVGQCFDGASNMAGRYSGVQARLKQMSRREPIFVHCWAHVLNLVLQDVVKQVPICARTFDLLQKMYVLIESSPKRHGEYLTCISNLELDNGLQILQSLSDTRWAARCMNLKIVDRCLPAVRTFLQMQGNAESKGLLAAVCTFEFIFSVKFLKQLFEIAHVTSQALQCSDTDLAAAAVSIENLKSYITTVRSDDGEFDHLVDLATSYCTDFGIDIESKRKRKKAKLPASLQNSVMDSFLTKASDVCALTDGENSAKKDIKVDFFIPVLDAVSTSINSRFNEDCMKVVRHISSVLSFTDRFEQAVRQLSKLAKLDADICIAEGKLLFRNDVYNTPNIASSLQCFVSTMVGNNHCVAYKHFYSLLVYLLTLPVTSAACERAHSKVDLVKSAIRASMSSDRLEDFIILSCEKTLLDNISLSAVVDRFALSDRGLPL